MGADKSLARPDWKTNERSPFFVRREGHCCCGDLVGRTTFWTFLNGLQKLQFGRCWLFSSWQAKDLSASRYNATENSILRNRINSPSQDTFQPYTGIYRILVISTWRSVSHLWNHCQGYSQPPQYRTLLYTLLKQKKLKTRGLSPRANYTDRAAAAGRRS